MPMRDESFQFLKQIEETPSVSGFEQPVARIVRKRMSKWADDIQTDVHGNVIVTAAGLDIAVRQPALPSPMR